VAAHRREGRIAFGWVETPLLPAGRRDRDAVVAALVTGVVIERYGREWRMGRVSVDRTFATGRIGFQRVAGSAEIWDEVRGDFRERAVLTGVTSAFALRLSDLRIAFQRRPGNIERQSFAGAFQALLNAASETEGWHVHPESDPVAFEEFVAEVDRLTKLTVRANRPNPNYRGRRRLEAIVEGAHARYLSLTLAAIEGDSLDPGEPTIAEAIQHVADEYGVIRAEGVRERNVIKYDSDRDGIAPEKRVELAADQREVTEQQVRSTLDSDGAGA